MATYILIHGAWHGGWCWDRIVSGLEAKGHKAIAPDLPGMGSDTTSFSDTPLSDWADFVADLVRAEKGQKNDGIILVGHSRGGMVISEVAERVPELVSRLVYLTAMLLPDGASLMQTIADASDDDPSDMFIIAEDGKTFTVVPELIGDTFYNQCSDDVVADATSRLCPEPLASFTTPVAVSDAKFGGVPRAYIEELEGVAGLTTYKDLPLLVVTASFFQFAISEESTFVGSGQLDGEGIPLDFFSDINIRKGFAYAFDWETFLTDAYLNEAQQVGSSIAEGLSYYDPNAPRYALDLDKAVEYLEKAWAGEVWEKGFTFTIAYNVGNGPRRTACEILQQNLLSINEKFTVLIQAMQWPTLLSGMYSQLLPMFQIGWMADYPDAHNFVYPFMHSSGTFSGWQSYSNPEVDALVADGISATTSAERESIYRELDQLYYDDVPSFPTNQSLGRRYFRDWVKGWYFNPCLPGGFGNLYELSKEY